MSFSSVLWHAFYKLTYVFLLFEVVSAAPFYVFLHLPHIFADVQKRLQTVVTVIFVIMVVAVSESCRQNSPTPGSLLPDDVELCPGDVVLRRGGGMASRAVLLADGRGEYSHVGIVVDSAGVIMVAHAVPGEPDYPGDPDRVKLESPNAYFDAGRANRGCVMRCADSAVAQRAAARAMQVYRRRTLFDHDYDDADTTRVYCCELVEAAYRSAGLPLAALPRHNVSLPWLVLDSVIFPSDFRHSPVLKVVAEF